MITREGATEQLRYLQELVDDVRARASGLCPYFFIWGAVWVVGYVASSIAGGDGDDLAWGVSLLAGGVASAVTGLMQGRSKPSRTALERRLASLNGVLIAFTVLGPFVFLDESSDEHLLLAWYPVLFGVIYLANGLFLGATLRWTGCWLVAAGLASLVMPFATQALWLAFAGGGSLLVTGVVLWRQGRNERGPAESKVAASAAR